MSFAQGRIYVDEQVRFASKHNQVYNIPMAFQLDRDVVTISISRLQRALRAVVMKHETLRSTLYVDNNGNLAQSIISMHENDECFGFTVIPIDHESNLNTAIEKIFTESIPFDLSQGRVLACHIFRHTKSSPGASENLSEHDVVLFNVHHSVFDGASTHILLHEITKAYDTDALLSMDQNPLDYIDYAVHEHTMDMSAARRFWAAQLDGNIFEQSFALPVDRHRLEGEDRSGVATSFELTFDASTSQTFFDYASSHNVTPFQLGLATFYAFLFKLNSAEDDFCVSCINANRYRNELKNMIGMFVATLPHRIRLDPNCSFDQLVEQVRQQSMCILEHSHYPLQHMLADAHHNQQSNFGFLETVFDFMTVTGDGSSFTLNGKHLKSFSHKQFDNVAKFDFMFSLVHNPSSTDNTLQCSFVCSQDVFKEKTVETLANRYSLVFNQLFHTLQTSERNQPIYRLSIVLPCELALIEALNPEPSRKTHNRKSTIGQMFSMKADGQPQKVAVELDDQCLTYSELLYYAQGLAMLLLDNYQIKPGEIVCQCVERSISMVS